MQCMEGADTRNQKAQVDIDACICAPAFYRSGASCSLCPVGAGCNFGRTCAFNNDLTCDGIPIVGTWVQSDAYQRVDVFHLVSCQAGKTAYLLLNLLLFFDLSLTALHLMRLRAESLVD